MGFLDKFKKKPPIETDLEGYVIALLTLIAWRDTKEVTLEAKRPLPELASLTQDPDHLAWLSPLPVRREAIAMGSDWVIGFLIGSARHPSKSDPSIETTLRAKLAIADKMEDVAFLLTMTTNDDQGTRSLKIRLQG